MALHLSGSGLNTAPGVCRRYLWTSHGAPTASMGGTMTCWAWLRLQTCCL